MARSAPTNKKGKKSTKGTAAANANKALAEANARMSGKHSTLFCFVFHFLFLISISYVAQVAELRAQLEAVAQQQSTLPLAPHTVSMEIIPRPAGEHGRNWNLRNMLADYDINQSRYNHMLVSATIHLFHEHTSNLS